MIRGTAANPAKSSMLLSDLICEEEHVSAVKVGTTLAERNASRSHLEDYIDWSQLTDGAKR